MNFEIVGVHPANKGAVLMLEAIRARLSARYPGARFAVPMDWQPDTRLAHGLWATPGRKVRAISRITLLDRMPAALQDALGYIPSAAIDVLLDASGFGYGDYWGLPKLQGRLADRLAWWKQGRKKAILLPQALGPFEAPGMADTFRSAVESLDLALVRDAASQGHVEVVLKGNAKVLRAPDFTNLLKPELPRRLEALRGAALVIPNEKMVAGKGQEVRERYLDFLVAAVGAIRASGREATILLHEGSQDRALAEALNGRLDRAASVVDEPSALDTKAIIAVAELIVSSRFHGLVSALSSGVPALACGWSHKYRELMSDYGSAELALDIDDRDGWASGLSSLLEGAGSQDFRARLMACADAERSKSEAMWARVEAVIDGG